MDEKRKARLAIARDEGEQTPPEVREALTMAETDAEAQQLLHKEQAFDTTFAAKLNATAVPQGLQARILAAAAARTQTSARVATPFRPGGIFNWMPLSLAACLVALLALTVVFQPGPVEATEINSLTQYIDAVGDYSSRISGLNYENDVGEMREYLARMGSPVPESLPDVVANLQGFGCQPLDFDGIQASLICFEGDSLYHLFIAQRDAIPGETSLDETISRKCGEFDTITWTSGDKVYVLTSIGGKRCQ